MRVSDFFDRSSLSPVRKIFESLGRLDIAGPTDRAGEDAKADPGQAQRRGERDRKHGRGQAAARQSRCQPDRGIARRATGICEGRGDPLGQGRAGGRSRQFGIGSSAAPARPIAGTVTRTERASFQAATLIEASGLLLVLGLVARAARNHRHF
jgi:hypothetical protein